MSKRPSFANLRTKQPESTSAPSASGVGEGAAPRASAREGRKQVAGFFSPEMSFALHMLARRQGRSLQALMSEAFDDVLRKHGESPVGG